jgi:hypothetical protein
MSRPTYIVTRDITLPSGRVDTGYWHGPRDLFGTTSSPHRSAAATFPHRVAAEDALRSVFGTVAAAKRRGYKVVADRH